MPNTETKCRVDAKNLFFAEIIHLCNEHAKQRAVYEQKVGVRTW